MSPPNGLGGDFLMHGMLLITVESFGLLQLYFDLISCISFVWVTPKIRGVWLQFEVENHLFVQLAESQHFLWRDIMARC